MVKCLPRVDRLSPISSRTNLFQLVLCVVECVHEICASPDCLSQDGITAFRAIGCLGNPENASHTPETIFDTSKARTRFIETDVLLWKMAGLSRELNVGIRIS